MRKRGIVALGSIVVSLAIAIPSMFGADGSLQPAAATTIPPPNLSLVHASLTQIASGIDLPVAFAWRKGDFYRMYVAEQSGHVVIIANGQVVGTVLNLTVSHGNEQGLLGIAFSGDGTKLYVDYTDTTGDIHVVEYTMSGDKANLATRRGLILIPHHTFANHNGGNLVLAGNLLYIGTGDGGGAGDTLQNAQNLNALQGKILRIDVRPNGAAHYTIPATNPFVGQTGVRPEIWMYGLRNPWRYSFDRTTHDLWIGDVGQNLYEEVDYAPAGQSGINWGWNLREGLHPYNGGAKPPGEVDPILERPHTAGDCAIIGGFVYRGLKIQYLNGAYVFGDECTGKLRAIVQQGGAVTQSKDLLLTVPALTTFGQGPTGELYAASRGGRLFVLTAA